MQAHKKINFLFFSLALSISALAQNYSDIQEYDQRLMFNPSFSGSTFGGRIYGNFFASRSIYNGAYTKILSADFFFPEKKKGLGICGGVRNNGQNNTFSLFGEGAMSMFIKKGSKYLIPSASLGLEQPLTQISLFVQDMVVNGHRNTLQLPPLAKIKTGLILANYQWNIGISGAMNWKFNLDEKLFPNEDVITFRMVMHGEKTFTYFYRGLLSRKIFLKPRFLIDIGTGRAQFFGDIKLQRKKWLAGFALLHSLKNNKSVLAISTGHKFTYFDLNYQASTMIPSSGNFRVIHSLHLKVIIPKLNKERMPINPLIRDI